MRRISEKRKEIPEIVQNIKKIRENEILNLNTDILFTLRNYDKRIFFYSESNLFRTCKKFLKTKLEYSERIPFDLKIDFYKNLEILSLKNTNNVDLGYFNNKKLKTIELNKIENIKISTDIFVSQLRIINCIIEIDTFLKILKLENLKSLTLKNVKIYKKNEKFFKPEINTFCNSESTENENNNEKFIETHIFYDEIVNKKIFKSLQNSNLKKLVLLDTNIFFETVKKSEIFKELNFFKFNDRNQYMYFSFSYTIYSYLKTNLEEICIKNIEHLILTSSKVLYQEHDFTNIKQLDVSNINITSELVDIFRTKFIKTEKFTFYGCVFLGVSFTKFISAFREKISYLNLIDSELPMDSLSELRNSLKKCKVIFRDRKNLIL
ncbi:leucine-rich repeat-containing protein [Vairimorpha necatrix]|uniref:Leucine-rich repeat-containing protein n=1 Tax=Vairimorpha necatrix TaxID=6039 RepID=A0AAX4JE50_9MICR